MNTDNLFHRAKDFIKGYFDLHDELDDEQTAVQAVMDGVSFKGSNIIILIIAIFIASLGLNTNSAAVIIGAMLISPLMGPILGMGFGLGVYDFDLIKRSFRNLAIAATFSVLASTLFFLISPFIGLNQLAQCSTEVFSFQEIKQIVYKIKVHLNKIRPVPALANPVEKCYYL